MDTKARALWARYEPVHAVTYFAPEARAAYEAAGLRGYWRGYFAGRAAPLGRVGPEPVVAAFFGFAPSMVARALPSVWDLASPDEALRVRREGAVAALARVVPSDAPVEEAAALMARAVASLDLSGRVLGAAHAALPMPSEPLAKLWHAASVLREHRGDGHVAALVAADLDPCEALVWRCSLDMRREDVQPNRGWTDDEWAAATERLTDREWLDASANATWLARDAQKAIEGATDDAAARAWRTFSDDEVARLLTLLEPIAEACWNVLPEHSPIGVLRQETARDF